MKVAPIVQLSIPVLLTFLALPRAPAVGGGIPGDAPTTLSDATAGADGILLHEVKSPYESGTTRIRVLLPDKPAKDRRYPVIYVLPVEARDESRYGDGLLEVKRGDLHNRHQAVFVAPTFSHLPWYADHPTDREIRQETYLLSVVVPYVESHYPVRADAAGRLLLGFSKSGWGAFSLLLRHPDRFGGAAAWDAPLMMGWPSRFGSAEIFGSRENFERYEITRLLRRRADELHAGRGQGGEGTDRGGARLVLMGYGNFRRDTQDAHALMRELKIDHEYRDGPERKHEWGSGWLPEAVELLLAPARSAAAPVPPATQPARPNILFVFADQWRAGATGYAGDPNVRTPNLDRLEAVSINFTHAVSACPVCTPFRASLMTGQRPTTHGLFLNDAHLPDDAATLGKSLSAAGYDTGFIGKWHLDGRGRLAFTPAASRQGFQYWKAMECTHDYDHSFYYAGDNPERLLWPGYDAAAQTEDAKRYIREHAGIKREGKGDRPFALFLAWGPPHNPYGTAPEEYRKLYDPAKIQLRPNVPSEVADRTRHDLAGYYAHCTALDRYLGELWQTLSDAGIERDTILIFTADHGDMLGSHGQERKQKPWDEALRTPMLWHHPAAFGPAGKKLDAVISSEDLMPTLLGLCGVPIPASVEGLDYSGCMRGGPSPNPDNAALITCVAPFGEWSRKNGGREFRGLRTARYTYVRDLHGPWLLYDNETDPYQEKNLVGSPEAAELQAKLNALLDRRLKSAGDEFLPGEKYVERWHYVVDKTGTLPTSP